MFLYQMATVLHETDMTWDFAVHYSGDIFAVNRNGGSAKTDLHVLSARTNYQSFSGQYPTGLHTTDANWNFAVGTNRDLYAICRSGASGRVELHVLTVASGYQQFSNHITTALHAVDANWELLIGPDEDLYAVTRQGASGMTEVHVMRSENQYSTLAFQMATGLHVTGSNWSFAVSPNRDIVCALHRGASGMTEFHILSAESNYRSFSLQSATSLHPIDATWALAVPQPQSPGFIQRRGTGSRKTEVHVPSLAMPASRFESEYFQLFGSMDNVELNASLARCGIDVAWGAASGSRAGIPGAVIGGATAAIRSRACQTALSEYLRERADRERFERMDRINHELERWERSRDIA
jgi:hypothetical protein